jgi:hypothetical protein
VNAERIAFFKSGTKVVKKSPSSADVTQEWKISQLMYAVGKEGCGKQWERRILGAAGLYRTLQGTAALYNNLVHELNLRCKAYHK